MMGYGAKLPRKRQQAIAALIEASKIREAAGIVGITCGLQPRKWGSNGSRTQKIAMITNGN